MQSFFARQPLRADEDNNSGVVGFTDIASVHRYP
jgi:hypothetical protein